MSLLGNLFSKKNQEADYPSVEDFSSVGVDMHSHLIPGIDDGVKTISESVEMIRAFAALGYRKLITTPHVMSDYYRNSPETILEGLETVKAAVKAEGISIELGAAAEYYLDEMLIPKIKSGEILTFGSNYLLFEISYVNPPDNIMNAVFEMNIAGYTPVLAHPERYPFWYEKFDEFEKLKEAGVLLQLNVNSLIGYYGPGARQYAEKFINAGMIDFIGSDLHGQRHLEALQKVVHDKTLHKLLHQGIKNNLL